MLYDIIFRKESNQAVEAQSGEFRGQLVATVAGMRQVIDDFVPILWEIGLGVDAPRGLVAADRLM